jgi:hypothetical protein
VPALLTFLYLSSFHSHFESNNLPYLIFYPKPQKTVKTEIQLLPFTIPAEDISDGLVNSVLILLASNTFLPSVNRLQKEEPQPTFPSFSKYYPGKKNVLCL